MMLLVASIYSFYSIVVVDALVASVFAVSIFVSTSSFVFVVALIPLSIIIVVVVLLIVIYCCLLLFL